MIDTIAVIAAIAEKKKLSDHMETTLQRSQRPATIYITFYISATVVAAIAGEWLRMIAMIAAIADVHFFSEDRSDHSDGSDHMVTGL